MRLLVYMRDGRTVYLIVGRGALAALVGADPWDDATKSIGVARGTWNPTTGAYVWTNARLRHVARGSISHVEEASYTEDEPPPR